MAGAIDNMHVCLFFLHLHFGHLFDARETSDFSVHHQVESQYFYIVVRWLALTIK